MTSLDAKMKRSSLDYQYGRDTREVAPYLNANAATEIALDHFGPLLDAVRHLDQQAIQAPDGSRRCYSEGALADAIDGVKAEFKKLLEP